MQAVDRSVERLAAVHALRRACGGGRLPAERHHGDARSPSAACPAFSRSCGRDRRPPRVASCRLRHPTATRRSSSPAARSSPARDCWSPPSCGAVRPPPDRPAGPSVMNGWSHDDLRGRRASRWSPGLAAISARPAPTGQRHASTPSFVGVGRRASSSSSVRSRRGGPSSVVGRRGARHRPRPAAHRRRRRRARPRPVGRRDDAGLARSSSPRRWACRSTSWPAPSSAGSSACRRSSPSRRRSLVFVTGHRPATRASCAGWRSVAIAAGRRVRRRRLRPVSATRRPKSRHALGSGLNAAEQGVVRARERRLRGRRRLVPARRRRRWRRPTTALGGPLARRAPRSCRSSPSTARPSST